jgi:DNA-binding transcriptional LysR family regulator
LPAEHPEITSRELINDELVLVFSINHPMAKAKVLTFDNLRELKMALPSIRISSARGLLEYFGRHSVQPNVVVEYDDGHALIRIVKDGNLVTCLPKVSVEDIPDIKILPLPGEGQKIKTGAMWMHMSPAAKAFLEIASAHYKGETLPA